MASARANARRLGNDTEFRIAKTLGGTIWAGQDGDVEARGYRVECKYRSNLNSAELGDWHNQIGGYEKSNPGKEFVLAYTAGKKFQNAQIWISMKVEEFIRLTNLDKEQKLIDAFKAEKAGEFDHARQIIEQLAISMAREMVAHGDVSLGEPSTLDTVVPTD